MRFITSIYILVTLVFACLLYICIFETPGDAKPNYTVAHVTFENARPYDMDKIESPNFIQDFKNPCFYNNNNNINTEEPMHNISCLPYFFVAGWTKAGSTDFWYRLTQHAHIHSGKYKELRWWSMGRKSSENHMGSYLGLFDKDTQNIISTNELQSNGIIGDFSPQYSWDNDMYPVDPANSKDNPISLNPHRIAKLLPKAKIIFLLRNPTDLIFSDYKFFGQGNKTTEDFDNQITNAISWWNACLKRHKDTTCAYGSPSGLPALQKPSCDLADTNKTMKCLQRVWEPSSPATDRLRIAIYEIHLREWFNVFDSKQILIVPFSDYTYDPVRYITYNVLPFLGVRNYTANEIENQIKFFQKFGRFNMNLAHQNLKMLPETKYNLDMFFDGYNKALISLLGSDITLKW